MTDRKEKAPIKTAGKAAGKKPGIPKKEAAKVKDTKAAKTTAATNAAIAKPAKTGATVTLRQVKSGAGRSISQNATLVGLGLRRIGKVSTVEDTAATRGMIRKVAHLIEIVDAA